MDGVESLEKQIEDIAASKRNSFSRNVLRSYRSSILEYLSSKASEKRIEWFRKTSFTYYGQDISESLACILWTYKNLTVHAIDEGEAPVPFSVLENIYKDAVFVLQYLKEKRALALQIEDVKQDYYKQPDGSLCTDSSSLQRKFLEAFQYSWNYTKFDVSATYTANHIKQSYLDFGFLKSAMSLRKTYGIQDLLEIGFQIFEDSKKRNLDAAKAAGIVPPSMSACRIVFNIEHPDLSTITLSNPNTMLTLQGKTKVVHKGFTSKIALAIKICETCNVDRINRIKDG